MSCQALDDCDRPVEKAGLCAGHRKQKTLGKPFTPLSDSRAGRLTYHQVMVEAALALADADSDDDRAFDRATDNLRKAAISYARQAIATRIKEGLARRRAAGLPSCGPPKLTHGQALDAVKTAGGIRAAARALGVSRDAVRRALRRSRPTQSTRR